MNTEHKDSIKDKILRDIHAGEVTMTPRAYFTLKVAALAATTLAVLVISIFIFNFIYFSIRISSHDALLGFGPRGLQAFLLFFPWPLLAVDIGLIIILQSLLRQFRLGYKTPILYLVIGLMFAAVLLGIALDRTSINDRLVERPDRLPSPIGGFFDRAARPPERGSGMCRCTVVAINGNVLTVQDTRNASSTLTVILPVDNPHATTTSLNIGDTLFIAGEEKDGVIQAFGVRKDLPGERHHRWDR